MRRLIGERASGFNVFAGRSYFGVCCREYLRPLLILPLRLMFVDWVVLSDSEFIG